MAADGEDVLSFGPPQWRRSWLLVPLAVGSLLLGYLWGSAGSEPVDAAAQERDPTVVLVAGVRTCTGAGLAGLVPLVGIDRLVSGL